MFLISFWQVLVFLIAFLSSKRAKNEGELGIIHGKARLQLNYMKNPSFRELQSLCQINQVCKEENQRRNITLTNFATTCKIFARQKKISQPFFTNCEIFASHAKCQKEYKLQDREQDCENFISHPVRNFASFAKILLCNF